MTNLLRQQFLDSSVIYKIKLATYLMITVT